MQVVEQARTAKGTMAGIDTDSINNLAWLSTLQTLVLFVVVGLYALWHQYQTKQGAHNQQPHERHQKMMRTLSNILRDMSGPGHVIP